jgi:hypothetical protein
MRASILGLGLTLVAATAAFAAPALAKWPPWLSIEAPANPFDPATRGAVMLVHGMVHDGVVTVSDLSGSAEGMENGRRRSIALRFDTTPVPGVFAVRRQWPDRGNWVIRITLARTTALVTLDSAGNVASVQVPTELVKGQPLPRAVSASEVDSTLALAARR